MWTVINDLTEINLLFNDCRMMPFNAIFHPKKFLENPLKKKLKTNTFPFLCREIQGDPMSWWVIRTDGRRPDLM